MTGPDEFVTQTQGALDELGSALRSLQDAATASNAPTSVATQAAEAINGVTSLLSPYRGELGTEHDFEHYVATSSAHTLNPPLTILRRGEGFIEMSVRFGPFYRNAFGYVNGGAIAMMFDTAIAHVAFEYAGRSYTANLNIDYRNLAPIDVDLLVKVRLESTEGRKHIVVAELFNGDALVSEAHSLLIQVRP